MRNLDLDSELDRIVRFIRDYTQGAGLDKLVLGLSGGVDSAVCAALAVRALGKEAVTALMLPYASSHPDSLTDARDLAERLGINSHVIEITPMVDAYFHTYATHASPLRRGNWMARTRMCVLFDASAELRALVLGTSNRTELMVGYFTQFGDSACALEPIGHLYKTEVWQLARLLVIPDKIVSKTPTADLWRGQSDEADLGMPYAELDEIIYQLTELDLDPESSSRLSFPLEQYRRVDKLMRGSSFKRQMPPLVVHD